MHELRPAPSPLLKASAFVARWTLALLLFAWLLVGVGWGLLHLAIVPRIGEFRPQLEAAASRMLGITVRIEAISAYSTGLIPAFELTNISLLDKQGRETLRLPRVLASLSPKSALALQFDQLYVDSPRLNIRRATDGRIFVAGFDIGSGSADEAVLDRIFSQPEFAIRHGVVVWTDEQRGLAPLALRDVDMVMRNAARRHDFRLDATPPAEWGDRFGAVARMEQPFLSMRNGHWQAWSGQVFAGFTRVDVSRLQQYAELGVDLRQGRGALRSWVEVRRGQVASATVDVALADVVVSLDPALQTLALATLSGRLAGRYTPGSFAFSTRDLAFDTADGLHWPGGNVALSQTGADASRPAHGEIQADRLDLAALSQIASRLPLAPQVHALLSQHAAGGLVESLKAKWEGTADAITKYEVQGKVHQLRVQARAAQADNRPGAHMAVGTPGLSGATVDFAMTERAGKASVVVQDGSMEFPGVFEEPKVPLAHFSGDVSWQQDNGTLRVDLPNARFGNADADGEMRLHWQTSDPAKSRSGARYPGVLDLQGSLARADGTRVYRYLPLVLHQQVRDYVRDAVQAGVGTGVKFKVKGDLHDMPFADPKLGEFQISAAIRNGVFSYVPRSLQTPGAPPWPSLSQLSGDLVFDRNSMRVSGARGVAATPGVQLVKADAAIADLAHAPVLVVDAQARGALGEMVAAVNGSPLASMTAHALAGATATGNAELRLKLGVPLDKPTAATVQGTVALAGNDVQFAGEVPRLARVRGVVNFSDAGFSVTGLQARVLGGDMRVDGGTLPPTVATPAPSAVVTAAATAVPALRGLPNVAFRAQGTVTVEGLRQARELGVAARLAQFATGSAAYVATFGLRESVPEFAISSNLVGLALNLPAPLAKTAEATLPLRLESALLREAPVAGIAARPRLQDQLVLDLGRVGSVTYVRNISGSQAQVVRGAIAVGLAADESAPLPVEGVAANIRVQTLDVDAWSDVLARLSGGGLAGLDPAAQDNSEAGKAARSYLPANVTLRAGLLEAGGRKLHNLVARGTRDGLTWRTNLDADELAGLIEYRQAPGAGAGRVYARLARLTLEQSSATDVETLLNEQPAAIPALDVVVEDLQLRGKKLGRLEIEAVNRFTAPRDGGVREWRLNRFDVTTPEAVFKATGNWTALHAQSAAGAAGKAEARRTVMNFQLDIHNAGELLGRFGMRDVVRRGKGSMEGQIAWIGSPLSLDYPTLGGAFSINVENGQFLKADPGLAKLLGVLSLQSLPRRLSLDFRDVFSEGFAFDFFRGDVKINQGIASANNLQMKGVNAAVLMDGQADLSRETQDIKVVVVPEINAGTASLIATAINPAVGLGSFLAQLFLRRPLIELATQEFHVDGSWVEPRITRVGRRAESGGGGKTEPAAPR